MEEFFKKMFNEANDKNKAEIANILSSYIRSKDTIVLLSGEDGLMNFVNLNCSMYDDRIGFYDDVKFVEVFVCESYNQGIQLIPTEALKEFSDTIECKKLVTEFSFALLK